MILIAYFGEKTCFSVLMLFEVLTTVRSEESCLICEYTGKGHRFTKGTAQVKLKAQLKGSATSESDALDVLEAANGRNDFAGGVGEE